MNKYASAIKIANAYGVSTYDAMIVISLVDELEKCGQFTDGMDKEAFINKMMAGLAVKAPKTFAGLTGASTAIGKATATNPMFNEAMMQGDLLGMGLTAGAGALKGIAGLYKKTAKPRISLSKASKGMNAAAPIVTATQASGLNTASKVLDFGGDAADAATNLVGMLA